MATKEAEKSAEKGHVTTGGTVLQGKIVEGKDNKLTAKEQGQVARGELDENLNPIEDKKEVSTSTAGVNAKNAARTDKEKAEDILIDEKRKVAEQSGGAPSGVKVVKPTETLYHGKISAEAIAAATGEPVSVVFEQAEPTTEDGLFYHFTCYHPSAKRDTFKFDLENKIDPTKRTYLERPR